MKRSWLPIAFLILGALGGVAIARAYAANRAAWATTQNAEIWAPTYQVASTAPGIVTSWRPAIAGGVVQAGARLGTVVAKSGAHVLRIAHTGRLIGDYGFQGDLVQAGQQLAVVADLSRPYVVAYVDETEAGKLAKGERVEVRFASDPSRTVRGTLAHIYPAVAEITWPLPALSAGTNFSKQMQWVPVRVDFPAGAGVPRYLGMSAAVRIAIGGGGS